MSPIYIPLMKSMNMQGVQAIHPLPVELFSKQVESIAADIDIRAVKVGMLGTAAMVMLWEGDWRIAVAIWVALVFNFLMGAATGVLIPLGLMKAKVDPALASAAFVTGFTDTFGFLFFLETLYCSIDPFGKRYLCRPICCPGET